MIMDCVSSIQLAHQLVPPTPFIYIFLLAFDLAVLYLRAQCNNIIV